MCTCERVLKSPVLIPVAFPGKVSVISLASWGLGDRCETEFAMNEPGASCVFEVLTVVLDDSRTSLNSLTTILGSMMLLFWTTEVKKPNSMCLG